MLTFQALSFNIFIPPALSYSMNFRLQKNTFQTFFREQAQCPDEKSCKELVVWCGKYFF